jgi:hypothetical protein
MVIVEFYKTDVGGVEHVTESLEMPRFADRQSFVLWAQIALPNRRDGPSIEEWPEAVLALSSRRNDPRIEEWPEAVRAIDQSGNQLFRSSLSDQSQA